MRLGTYPNRQMRRARRIIVLGAIAWQLHAGGARAATPDEIAKGRQLFAEALNDEEHQRFAAALEKYKRVVAIRDTASVRYRMASTLEGLGRVVQALDAYSAAVRLGAGNAADADVVKSAQARVDALAPRVAHVVLRVGPDAPPDAEVSVDAEIVPSELFVDLRVDAGPHLVTATAKGKKPFRAQITLSEGGRAEIPVTFEPSEVVTVAAPPPPPRERPEPGWSSLQTAGLVTSIAGGALLAGGVVALVVRSSAISDIKQSCPDGTCPLDQADELGRTRDRAVLMGPLGVTLSSVGVAAIGTGVVLMVVGRPSEKAAMHWSPRFVAGGAGVSVHGRF